MSEIHADELRTRLNRDLPGAVVPPSAPGQPDQPDQPDTGDPKKKPSMLETNTDVVVEASRLKEVALYIRDKLSYTYLSDIGVVDYLDDGLLELVYRFYRIEGGGSLVVKVRVPRNDAKVPSLTPVWPGANFHEREGYDLFGVWFTGHPDLRRLYMWDKFVGHPMRKDFPKQGDKYLAE
jgi:NADH-quinone oxidoreductase subunit C